VLAGGTVFAAHGITNYNSAAVDTLPGPVTMNMFAGRSLETAVAVRGRSAVNAMFCIRVMLMKSVKAFRTTGPEFGRSTMNTIRHENSLVRLSATTLGISNIL
jgi:hypothetical protein